MEPTTEKQDAKVRPCPQDCGKCNPWQQIFCCTKMSFELSKSVQALREEMEQLKMGLENVKQGLPKATALSNPML